ncbi:MAG TPA: phosphatase PAP2 family protein [Hanamia sp.]|nr:phosphatase PAP2 family protein [Hanamia sp.]
MNYYSTAFYLQILSFFSIPKTSAQPYYASDEVTSPRFIGPFAKRRKSPNGRKITSSFPSGHSTVAFAVATVFASEHKDKPEVPFIAYTAASLIGISRFTENKHWVTDVVTGAAIGYLSGKLVVNNYHRFNRRTSNIQKKNSISFTLNYSFGHLEPGMVYHFW